MGVRPEGIEMAVGAYVADHLSSAIWENALTNVPMVPRVTHYDAGGAPSLDRAGTGFRVGDTDRHSAALLNR
jgi:hypothetical protein